MMDRLLFALTLLSALGCGLIAGVFFAFSAFVMKALARRPPAQGIAAKQSINVVVITPLFMAAFFGTAAGCVVLAVSSLLMWHTPGAAFLFAGSLLYLVGTILVTMAFNVPRNDALAVVDPASADGARQWAGYVTTWTAGNHVRTAAALAAAALLTIALCLPRKSLSRRNTAVDTKSCSRCVPAAIGSGHDRGLPLHSVVAHGDFVVTREGLTDRATRVRDAIQSSRIASASIVM
jgi:uncharacterized membrane protein